MSDVTDAKYRMRFSLLNLVLFVTIAAMAVVLWKLYSELAPLRAENKKLNEERGTLVIADHDRVNAIRVPKRFAGRSGAFRVFIPEGKPYMAFAVVNNIPKTGLPEIKRLPPKRYGVMGQVGAHGHAFAVLPPGEHMVSLSVEQRKNGDRYVWLTGGPHGLDVTVHTPKDAWPDVEPTTFAVHGDSIKRTTESVAAGQPLVLFRHRLHGVSEESLNVSYSLPEPDYALDGMMLWIEPVAEDADE